MRARVIGSRAAVGGGTEPKGAGRLGALGAPRYRRYWLGSLAAVGATQLVTLAQGWLIVDELGGSPLSLGVLGAATAAPTIVVNLFGGVLADRVDRRFVLMITTLMTAALLLLLAVLDATGAVQIWHVVAIAAALGLVYGVDWPVRNSFFPSLIERNQMMSAVALNAMMWQGTRIVAPAIGGVVIAVFGTATAFFLAVGGSVAMSGVLMTLDVPHVRSETIRSPMQELAAGVGFIVHTRLFAVLILLSYAHMLLGMSYIQLMPLVAKEFESGSAGLGLLFTTIGLGAVSGTFVSLKVRDGRRIGRVMLTSLFIATVLILGFAVAPTYFVAVAILYFASLSNSIFLISSMTALQVRVPDAMRGRVMGIHGITFSMLPLGGLVGGLIANATDVRLAIALGAIAMSAIVAFVALTQPEVRELESAEA